MFNLDVTLVFGKFGDRQLISLRNGNATDLLTGSRFLWTSVLALLAITSSMDRPFAHEVWIEPTTTHLSKGETLSADLRIGDMFKGDHLIYIPQQTERLLVLTDTGSFDLKPRVGSRPVITVAPEKLAKNSGNVVLVYQSANSYVHYGSQEKFLRFARKKGAGDLGQSHKRRRLPQSGFVERYKRFAKAIITIGPETEMVNDRVVGMELEFVSLGKKLLSNSRLEFQFQLLYQGRMLPAAQVTLFSRDRDGLVTSSKIMTDEDGVISINADAEHRYLLDHVTLRETDPLKDRNRPVWESLWASLTFAGLGSCGSHKENPVPNTCF